MITVSKEALKGRTLQGGKKGKGFFKYLGTILCKHGNMEGEIRERTLKGRQVMDALKRVMT